ncbi:antibiotic biosynthesis monooxygenase [Micromonospora sp. NPDC047548]|uniref:putative quinol monooxygenase n=1 Tax=Micromonospora sp. NPDC047548 TaxID=3155624 RepID=UPI0033FF780A
MVVGNERGRSERMLPPPSPRQAVLAQFIAGPGRADAVRDALLQLVRAAREERGNLGYDVHQLRNNPAAFYVLGNWADEQALDAHLASEHVRRCLAETVAGEIVAPYTLWRVRLLSEPDTRSDRPRPAAKSPAQVTLVPFFTIKAGEETAVGNCHLEMVGITRAEPGCLGYDLYQSVEDPPSCSSKRTGLIRRFSTNT